MTTDEIAGKYDKEGYHDKINNKNYTKFSYECVLENFFFLQGSNK